MLWELKRQSTANAVNATGSLVLVGPTFEEYGFRESGVPDVFDNAGDGIPCDRQIAVLVSESLTRANLLVLVR